MVNYNIVYAEVEKILGGDKSGHSMEHILTVVNNAKLIMSKIDEKFNEDIVLLACYLHDVDDYKLVGKEAADKLENTHSIINKLDISEEIKQEIIYIMKNMGYSKSLEGIRPKTIEGMIVSDADMLDAIGSAGLVRTIQYNTKKGNGIFKHDYLPNKEIDAEKYKNSAEPAVNHFFEKLLLIKNMMMTKPGQDLAQKRHNILYLFLENLFEENHEDCSEWQELLTQYK